MSGRRDERPGVPGRPPKPQGKKRSKILGVRFSEEELRTVEERADGEPLSCYLRRIALGEQRRGAVPRANRAIAGQLAKIGNNLNQLVRLAHTGRLQAALEPQLKRLLAEITRYRQELLGSPREGSDASGLG
jgi:hypothetical protein